MGSGDLSHCLPYFLSWGNEEQVSAASTKSLAGVLRRQGVLQTGPLEMASHHHTGRDMPLEELLALYGYDLSNPLIQQEREPSALSVSLPDITLNKDHITKDLFSREEDGEEEVQSLADDLTPSVASENSDILQCHLRAHSLTSGDKDISVSSSEDDDSDSASIPSNDSHKDIMVGPQYQATIPPLSVFSYQDKVTAYESEDQLLWTPAVLPPSDVEKFLLLAQRQWGQGRHADAVATEVVKDNEQALYELVKCNFNAEEALRRLHFNVKVFNEELCAWSEEECRNFEHGYRVHGKNFHLIQANKVRTRSVGECVEYYYLWKKSERHDFFIQQTTRLGRRKYNMQLGNIDDGEPDGEVGELERSSSSNSHSSSHTSTGQSNTPSPSPDLEKQDAGCGMIMGELCAASFPCSRAQESVFSHYPPLPSLEELREPPPPCSDSLSPPQLFPSSYSPSSSPFTCTSTSHSSPPRTPDSQLPGPGFYHLQLGSYLQDDLPSGSDCGHGLVPVSSRMEVDFSMPPVLPLMPPTPSPPSPSASVTAELGSLGGFPLPPPLCPAPVQHPRSLTQ